jgi:tripartite-type tricarboxylate transporter receptor subunit TctC
MAEQGAAEAEVRSSLPLYGQTALPEAIVTRLNAAMRAVLVDPETQKRLDLAYIQPLPMSPAETAAALQAEHERLARLIRQLGIKADGVG